LIREEKARREEWTGLLKDVLIPIVLALTLTGVARQQTNVAKEQAEAVKKQAEVAEQQRVLSERAALASENQVEAPITSSAVAEAQR
jgi:galactokinase/mevalonate kinase-like predicted kinase